MLKFTAHILRAMFKRKRKYKDMLPMIIFITDQLSNNKFCLIQGREFKVLTIKSLTGDFITDIKAPENGWTTERLIQANSRIPPLKNGANAYLDTQWVGSTIF